MNLHRLKKEAAILLEDYQSGIELFPKASALAAIGAGLLMFFLLNIGLYLCIPGVFFLFGAALEDNANREIRRELLYWTGLFFLIAQYPTTTSLLTLYNLDASLFNKMQLLLDETILGKAIFAFCFYSVLLIAFTMLEWFGERVGRVVSIGGGDILFFTIMTLILPLPLFLFGVVGGSVCTLLFSFFWKRPVNLEESSYKDYPPAIPGLLFGMGIAPLIQQFIA